MNTLLERKQAMMRNEDSMPKTPTSALQSREDDTSLCIFVH